LHALGLALCFVAFQAADNENELTKFSSYNPMLLSLPYFKTHCRHTLKQFKTLASATEKKIFP
jgi:hypothetical protein